MDNSVCGRPLVTSVILLMSMVDIYYIYTCITVLQIDTDIQRGSLDGHTDAIWGLVLNQSNGLLISCGADGQCILWDPVNSSQVKCIVSEPGQ